jgi:hypothetical protein
LNPLEMAKYIILKNGNCIQIKEACHNCPIVSECAIVKIATGEYKEVDRSREKDFKENVKYAKQFIHDQIMLSL